MVKHKQRWIKKVYRLLCKYQGVPENENEKKNMRQWAKSLAGDDPGYFRDGYTPLDAVHDEMSYA